jgi:transposase
MGTARRQYTDEFKREAVGLLASSGRPLSQIAGELGIPAARLRAWCNRNAGRQAGSPRRPITQTAIPPAGLDLATENVRLRRENERLRMEREILKKTRAPSRSYRNEIPHHRRSARDIPGSCPVRCHGRLYGRVLCLARPARKSAQGGQSCSARRDPAPPSGPSRALWRAKNPCGLVRLGAQDGNG